MVGNAFGTVFRFSTFGESHGPAIGCVIDGVPPCIPLDEHDIQKHLDRRRPGTSRFVTQRHEPDIVRIVSGVFQGQTTGTPIGLLIENTDQRSRDYTSIATQMRPGHADFTYMQKYGIRDWRGGGRSSARETAMRVAAGSVARKVLDHLIPEGVLIRGALVQLGSQHVDRTRWDWEATSANPFFCPNPESVPQWEAYLDEVRKRGSSCGALLEVVAERVPAGLGCPVYDKLDADLAKALMSINAVKAVEIGDGFAVVDTPGDTSADEMSSDEHGQAHFESNHAGGILGGISTGQPLVVRLAVKPTSSLPRERNSINTDGQNVKVRVTGRHDPCVGIRAVPVAEAMVAITLADHLLRHRAQCGFSPKIQKATSQNHMTECVDS